MKARKVLQTAAVIAALSTAGGAGAATIVKDLTNPATIPGLTGFTTTGAMMDGMSVTACFTNVQTCQTVFWADTGVNSGAAAGTGWTLSLAGDTFSAAWNFDFISDTLGQLTSLVLDGSTGLTVFDTTQPAPGTPDSANGTDFAILNNAGLNANTTATYSGAIRIAPNAPVGDLFHVVSVTFAAGTGPRTDFSFVQDTDNDARFSTVAEPGTLALLGLGLAGIGLARRRKQ